MFAAHNKANQWRASFTNAKYIIHVIPCVTDLRDRIYYSPISFVIYECIRYKLSNAGQQKELIYKPWLTFLVIGVEPFWISPCQFPGRDERPINVFLTDFLSGDLVLSHRMYGRSEAGELFALWRHTHPLRCIESKVSWTPVVYGMPLVADDIACTVVRMRKSSIRWTSDRDLNTKWGTCETVKVFWQT